MMIKTKATRPGKPSLHILMTEQEESIRTSEQLANRLPNYKRTKKQEIRYSAEIKLLSIHRDYDLNFIKTMYHSWAGIDQTKVRQKLRDAMTINTLMRSALKAVRTSSTEDEVNAIPIPMWPD